MQQTKQKIETAQAPKALGPYSQGVSVKGGEWVFVSGQLPIDPVTNALVKGDIQLLTRQVIKNLEAILQVSQIGLEHVVRTDVFLTDLNDFKLMNEEYARHFKGPTFPVRQTIQVAALPLGSSIEISCIAYRD
jgi:2-iminobutanoate/2-iminopropanoate deaminase